MIFVFGYDGGNTICLIKQTIIIHYVCMVCYRRRPMDNELRKDLGHNIAYWKLRSKENKRLALELGASEWNKTKHRGVYVTAYGSSWSHIYVPLLSQIGVGSFCN